MPRCELSGKSPVVKNLVSHSNIKTKSTAHPNIQKKQLFSRYLGHSFNLKIAVSVLRDVEHRGGLDAYILKQDDIFLSKRALTIKNRIKRKINLPVN